MGRIVIPRYQRQRAQLKQRPKGRGYFANGFGPQEMSLISKLTDLAVAGGGQIARAVQISNREEEQAKAQADYDRKIQANAEERRAAAQGLVDATDIDGQVEAFFAQQEPPSVRERLPSMSSMNLQSDLVQPRPMQGGVLSPGVLARPGALAPEDLSMARAQMATMLQADAMESAMQRPDVAAVFDYGDEAGFEAVENAMRRGVVDPAGMPRTSVGEAEGIMNAASTRAYLDALQRLEQLDRQGAQESVRRLSSPLVPQEQMLDLVSRYDVSPGSLERMNQRSADYSAYTPDELVAAGVSLPAAPTRQGVQLGRPSAFSAADEYGSMQRRAAREQEMQGRDFRQEAISEIGPAPEAKPFRIADILAQASSARTAEQRAMLLQAAADSPDIQASNLSDLAKGAYRDRAMQAVMKLFPEEEEALSEYELLRMQSMRESMETENLRQQKLQAELDKSAAKAARRANALKSVRPKDSKKEEAYSFYVQHWAKHDRGEMSDEDWVAGAGELANVDPGGLRRWAETNKLSRATRKAATQDANTVMRLRAPKPPAPVRTDLTPSDTSRIQGDIARFKMKEVDAESAINKWKAFLSNPKQLKDSGLTKHQVDQAIAGERRKATVAREIISANEARLKAKPEATPAPSGAVYTAPPEGETEQEKYNRLNARLK